MPLSNKLKIDRLVPFSTQSRKFAVSLKPPVGELMQKNPISQDEFIAEKGRFIFAFFWEPLFRDI